MIIRINEDYFMVMDEDFKNALEEHRDDSIKLSEWVEMNGVLISDKEYILLSRDEAESLIKEFSWSWISRENPLCNRTLNRIMKFTAFDPTRKKAPYVRTS